MTILLFTSVKLDDNLKLTELGMGVPALIILLSMERRMR